ncbi:RNA polymerase sigma factor [Segetibacter sp. 3557_3]|uniref:RNA polymerase sigma factor n=1 Tax=Segetibacter sp. 3557_3 TaxID=2547429 RepID=UPI001405217C|nr:sigma-70 family RNA polymerase sigma factor [Segetibacter sp. 3557_3]
MPDYLSYTDKDLLTVDNDHAGFQVLYDRYWKALYEKARGRCGNKADTEDVVQEVFISLWRNRKKVQLNSSLEPYLFTALKYSIIKKLHRQSKQTIPFPPGLESLMSAELTSYELLQYKELQDLISQQVSQLPERMRQIYQLSRVDYLSTMEIADTLGISEQTVKNTLTTAIARLRKDLSGYNALLLFLF